MGKSLQNINMVVYSDPKTGRLTGHATGGKPLFLEDAVGANVKRGGFRAILDPWQEADDNDLVSGIADAFGRSARGFRGRFEEALRANLTAEKRLGYREVLFAAAKAEVDAQVARMEGEAKGLEDAAAKAATETPAAEPSATPATEAPKAPAKGERDPAQIRRWMAELKRDVERACDRRPRSREIKRRIWLNGWPGAMTVFRLPNGNVAGDISGSCGGLSPSADTRVEGGSWDAVHYEVDPSTGKVLKLEQRRKAWFAEMVPDRRQRGKMRMRNRFMVAPEQKPCLVVPHSEPRGSETSVRFLFTREEGKLRVNPETGNPVYPSSPPDLASLFADGKTIPTSDEQDRRDVRIGEVILTCVRRVANEAEKKRGRTFIIEVRGAMHRSMDGTGGFNELICFSRDAEGKHWDIEMYREGTVGQASISVDDDEGDSAAETEIPAGK